MLIAVLIAANYQAIARAQTYDLDVPRWDNGVRLAARDEIGDFRPDGTHFCRAPFLCTPAVKPYFKNPNSRDLVRMGFSGLPAKGTFESGEGELQERNASSIFADNLDGPHGSVVYDHSGVRINHGMFVCGEVGRGYRVTCAHRLTKATVAAPELDTSFVVTGMLLVLGCLAVLRGRRQPSLTR
jgi:hypothetical protein